MVEMKHAGLRVSVGPGRAKNVIAEITAENLELKKGLLG